MSPGLDFRRQAPMMDRPVSNRYQISGSAASSTALSSWSCERACPCIMLAHSNQSIRSAVAIA